MVIVLHREFSGGTIGITLAGGADYESKEITVRDMVRSELETIDDDCQVHKVIAGSLADRDGRIQKGDRVLSINGRSTKGITHREALSILKVAPSTTGQSPQPSVSGPQSRGGPGPLPQQVRHPGRQELRPHRRRHLQLHQLLQTSEDPGESSGQQVPVCR